MLRVPKSLVHVSAFTAASLLRRLIEFRAEFETLHSMGMMRWSQSRTTMSALREPNTLSLQNSPALGARFSVGIVLVSTLCIPALLRVLATRSSCASLPSWRLAVSTLRAAIRAAEANTAAARSSAVGSRLSEIPIGADEIHHWLAENRVNAQTLVQAGGQEWKPLIAFPEFAAEFKNAPPPI